MPTPNTILLLSILVVLLALGGISLTVLFRMSRKMFDVPVPPEGFDEHLLLCADVVEALPDGIVVVDQNRIIHLVNRELELMSGYDRSELRGNAVEILVPEGLRGGHVDKFEGYKASPATRPMNTGLDTQLRRSDGLSVPVEIAISPKPRRGGTKFIATVRRKN